MQEQLVMQIRHKQKGLALMMLVFVFVLATAAYTYESLNAAGIQSKRDKTTKQVLIEAKEALIGYAVTYDDAHAGESYGYLPCPDRSAINGAGSELSCGSAGESTIGRLPWKTLKISPVKDGSGECLWYAVSGSFKNNPKQPLDPLTLGQLNVKTANGGSYAGSDVDPLVAVVFAPGSIIGSQNRADNGEDEYCGGNYVATNYLDTVDSISNADASDSTFVIHNSDSFNDQLIVIRQSEIFKSYCGKYARKLSSNIVGNTNHCDNGGSVSGECLASHSNVQNCSCKLAADTLITQPCLSTNPLDLSCLNAVDELKVCNA